MRSLAQLRFSLAACGVAGLAAALAQLVSLQPAVPVEQLRLAWILARVLIQL